MIFYEPSYSRLTVSLLSHSHLVPMLYCCSTCGYPQLHVICGLYSDPRSFRQMQVLEWVDDLLQHPELSCLLATLHTVSIHTTCALIASKKQHMRPLLARSQRCF